MSRVALPMFLALALPLSVAGSARANDAGTEDFEKSLNTQVQGSWVISVTDLGDIILFGGAITVPVHRPSVERCGEWITVAPEARAAKTQELLKEADRVAIDQKLSKMEKQQNKMKALAPLRSCEAEFKKRCEEAKSKPLAARKAAIDGAKKSIGEILNAKDTAAAKDYLALILKQCPLGE
jgi:hypothetical protein